MDTGTQEPLKALQAEFGSSLAEAASTHPRARLTRRGRNLAALAIIAVVAMPTGAIALQHNEPEDPFVPTEQADPADPGEIAPCFQEECPLIEPIHDWDER